MKYLDRYTKELGCRFHRWQKKKARIALQEDFQELGMKSVILDGSSFLSKAKNVVVGNSKTAKKVVVVPYDTPPKVFWKNPKYFPQNGSSNMKTALIVRFVPMIIVYSLLIILSFFGVDLVKGNAIATNVLYAITVTILLLLVIMIAFGFENKKNYNRNSATIAAILNMVSEMDSGTRKQILFVFTDKNNTKNLGVKTIVKELEKLNRNMEFICLDCIGKGSMIQVGHSVRNKKSAHDFVKNTKIKNIQIKQLEVTDRTQMMMEWLDRFLVISRGEIRTKKNGEENLYVEHTGTGSDCMIDEQEIQEVMDLLKQYLQ